LFTAPPPPDIYTLSLHDALPIFDPRRRDIAVPGGLLLAWILKRTGADGIVVGERGLREGIILDYAARHGKRRVGDRDVRARSVRSEEHTSELQSRGHLVCRLLLE